MEKISLSPRLQVLADWVPEGSVFADIGTDHGYLPLYLQQKGKISKAIACDVSQGPLSAARTMAIRYGLQMDFRLGDGLEKVNPCEVDCLAIAGMGGLTISQILGQWQRYFPEATAWQGVFLLQAMSTRKELRGWLCEQGYTIEEERTIPEGETLYNAMKVSVGKCVPFTDGELLVGRQRAEYYDPHRLALLDMSIEKIQKILGKLEGSSQNQRREELEGQRESLLAMRKEWLTWHIQ